jgi:hypothetical protein
MNEERKEGTMKERKKNLQEKKAVKWEGKNVWSKVNEKEGMQ